MEPVPRRSGFGPLGQRRSRGVYWPSLPLARITIPVLPTTQYTHLSDASIAYAFTERWLPWAAGNLDGGGGYPGNNSLQTPWFTAVSFINPHDITEFPWAFGLMSTYPSLFYPGSYNRVPHAGYQPPPSNLTNPQTYAGLDCLGGSGSCTTYGDEAYITPYNNSSIAIYASLPPGLGTSGPWNFEGNLTSKPGLQEYFLNVLGYENGVIASAGNYSGGTWSSPQSWLMFLNYYCWMQSCVDYQVGQILSSLYQSAFNNNTVVIFTADHGDYAGSHGLHAKAGALYEESLNVPLIISYPGSRAANNSLRWTPSFGQNFGRP